LINQSEMIKICRLPIVKKRTLSQSQRFVTYAASPVMISREKQSSQGKSGRSGQLGNAILGSQGAKAEKKGELTPLPANHRTTNYSEIRKGDAVLTCLTQPSRTQISHM
jgi:hypothetical protein